MAIKKIKLIEGVSDMFDKNLDPAVLRDRMNQAARTRDLALEAANEAENAGNTSLAAKLRKDAEDLQQILELTRQSANIHSDDEVENSTQDQAQDEAEADISSPETDDLSDETEDIPDEEPLADEEDEDNEDDSSTSEETSSENDDEAEADTENEAEEDTDSEDLTEPASDEEAENDHSSSAGDEEDTEEESGSDGTSSESSSSDRDANTTDNASSSESSSDDGEEASEDNEDEYDESDAYGTPKVKDDLVLQDPFKNDQIDMPMPKNISDALKNGSLKLEPEIDAIIRILSSLKGEARRGAEQALKDYFETLDPFGDIYEENS